MKLVDALKLVRQIPADAERVSIFLACSFTPLHLKTLLAAQVWQILHRKAEIQTGLYGDLLGSLRSAGEESPDFVVCAVEWPDLDPRLGLRSLGGWSPSLASDIIETTSRQLMELERTIEDLARGVVVALAFPTLPLPPISFTANHQAGHLELELRALAASAEARLARLANVRLLNAAELHRLSPASTRFDVNSELSAGFPYSLGHAAAMAAILARLVSDLPPKKGLITDLDDTLWKGIVGEVGVAGIQWTLDGGGQIHGLYQQLLAALAESGTLLAIASKNDLDVVEAALAHHGMILPKDLLFPIEAGWEPKSRMVSRILRAWNIAADSVVFVDDSEVELAEVAESHPGILCCKFPRNDPQAAYNLLKQLRDSFGKGKLLDEDRLRLQSLRRDSAVLHSEPAISGEDFLVRANPEMTAEYTDGEVDLRALELINKTNQFNLNGKRHTMASLSHQLQCPGAFMMVVSYKDKYGPLGKIAVLCGLRTGGVVRIGTWVMSCRAFARRIEYWCLDEIFRHFGVGGISLDFQPTERNGPLAEFLKKVLAGTPSPGCTLERADFEALCRSNPNLLVRS